MGFRLWLPRSSFCNCLGGLLLLVKPLSHISGLLPRPLLSSLLSLSGGPLLTLLTLICTRNLIRRLLILYNRKRKFPQALSSLAFSSTSTTLKVLSIMLIMKSGGGVEMACLLLSSWYLQLPVSEGALLTQHLRAGVVDILEALLKFTRTLQLTTGQFF